MNKQGKLKFATHTFHNNISNQSCWVNELQMKSSALRHNTHECMQSTCALWKINECSTTGEALFQRDESVCVSECFQLLKLLPAADGRAAAAFVISPMCIRWWSICSTALARAIPQDDKKYIGKIACDFMWPSRCAHCFIIRRKSCDANSGLSRMRY